MQTLTGEPFELLKKVSTLSKTGAIGFWRVLVSPKDALAVEGRLCVLRKSKEAIAIAHKKLKRNASKRGNELKPCTLEFAKYVILFTTFPKKEFSPESILSWYRLRWQVELVFKRFKSLAELGRLPKHDDESSKAWLYGKLLTALLLEKLVDHATFISPWGFFMEEETASKRLA